MRFPLSAGKGKTGAVGACSAKLKSDAGCGPPTYCEPKTKRDRMQTRTPTMAHGRKTQLPVPMLLLIHF